MQLWLRIPFGVQLLVGIYVAWILAAIGYTVWWTFGGPSIDSSAAASKVAAEGRYWYLNLWARRTKLTWLGVSMSLAVLVSLSLFIQDLL